MSIADISEVLLEAGLSGSVSETERAIASSCLKKAEAEVKRFLRYDPVYGTHIEFYPNQDFSFNSRIGIWEANDTEAYIRFLNEAATNELQLKNLPVRSITELKIDYDGRSGTRSGSFGSGTIKTEGVDFWANYDAQNSAGTTKLCRDGVLQSEGRWPNIPGSVKVTYVAGYTDAEFHYESGSIIDATPILAVVIDETIARMQKVYARMKKSGRATWATGPFTSENLGDYSYSQDNTVMQKLVNTQAGLMVASMDSLSEFVNWGIELAS